MGKVSPGEFIPVAEQRRHDGSGLACGAAPTRENAAKPSSKTCAAQSARRSRNSYFGNRCWNPQDLPADRLELEITESVFIETPSRAQAPRALHAVSGWTTSAAGLCH